MKDKLLKEIYRYDQSSKMYHVDIDLDEYRDVYSEWDYSPLVNRDLDDDLLEYLMGCSYELGLKRKMSVDFHIPKHLVNEKREERSIFGFRHYFSYRIRKTTSERFRYIKSTLTFLFLGIFLLVLAYIMEIQFEHNFFVRTLTDGLYIGAWVAIWEIFSIWFFQLSKLNSKVKHYKRLEKVKICYLEKK